MSVRTVTVFEFAGGQPAFLSLATAMHKRCLEDEMLNHPFSHANQNPNHIPRLSHYWAEVFGGPALYSQESTGHSGVLKMHANNGSPEDIGDMGERFFNCFVLAIDDANLPSDPDFRNALVSYMRWAVDEIMTYFPVGSNPPKDRPMPKWGWEGPLP